MTTDRDSMRDMKTQSRDSNSSNRDKASVTPSRARTTYGGMSRCHAVTTDANAVTVTNRAKPGPSPSRLPTEARFAGWLAGATEAQAERFRQIQARGAVKVADDELPPALRGGALEVF